MQLKLGRGLVKIGRLISIQWHLVGYCVRLNCSDIPSVLDTSCDSVRVRVLLVDFLFLFSVDFMWLNVIPALSV